MRSKPRSYIVGLDGLGGIAATMVFVLYAWGHSGFPRVSMAAAGLGTLDMTPLTRFGAEGVALFFALSGLLFSLPFGIACGYFHVRQSVRQTRLRTMARQGLALLLVLMLLAVVSSGIRFVGFPSAQWSGLPLLFAGLVLLVGLSKSGFGVAQILEFSPIRFLGKISYSFYLSVVLQILHLGGF